MSYEYEIYTTIPRDFEPDVMGETLDSIIKSCEGYMDHSVPFCMETTLIRIKMSKPLDREYLIDQLNDNFQEMGGPSVVKEIIRKSL